MKLISWNVNGIRSCMDKGFFDIFKNEKPDILCIQETKMKEGQAELDVKGYELFMNSADKAGYSGTAVWTKVKPLNVTYGIGIDEHDHEGRVIICEFEKFYLVNVYVPNSRRELERLEYRMTWEDDFRKYLNKLDKKKPVIVCGDMNVAHEEIDLKNPKTNHMNAGFTDDEREKMTKLLDSGFIDSFRYFYPEKTDIYSWWSYMFHAREKNSGWRIDYFLVSKKLEKEMKKADIKTEVLGSDHCPILLEVF